MPARAAFFCAEEMEKTLDALPQGRAYAVDRGAVRQDRPLTGRACLGQRAESEKNIRIDRGRQPSFFFLDRLEERGGQGENRNRTAG